MLSPYMPPMHIGFFLFPLALCLVIDNQSSYGFLGYVSCVIKSHQEEMQKNKGHKVSHSTSIVSQSAPQPEYLVQ